MVGRAAPAPDQLTGIEAAFGGRVMLGHAELGVTA
jgi:hypothetical protein